jgi:hypothetical protein
MLVRSTWLTTDASSSRTWDCAKLVKRDRAPVDVIGASTRSNKQTTVQLTRVSMMMMMLHIHLSGTVTTHAPNRWLLETMQGLSICD